MAGCQQQRRRYSSTLRQEQQELTRSRITKAVADLIRDGRIHLFTVEEVAQRAGVSYASVYRHFPTRERLLEEVYEWFLRRPDSPSLPEALDAVPAWIETLVSYFEANADMVHAGSTALAALGLSPRSQQERDDLTQSLVAKAAPGLDIQQVRARTAVIRYLVSSLGWATLRHRFGLDAGEVSSALRWALETLVREVGNSGADRNDGLEREEST